MNLKNILIKSQNQEKFQMAHALSEQLEGSIILNFSHLSEMYDSYESGQIIKQQVRLLKEKANYVIVISPCKVPSGLIGLLGTQISVKDTEDNSIFQYSGYIDVDDTTGYELEEEGDLSTLSSKISKILIKEREKTNV